MKNNQIYERFKKKKILVCMISIFGFLMCMTLAFAAYGKAKENEAAPSNAKTIILDAGHGGEDGGAVGVDGIVEKDINLSIALKLEDLLEVAGYNVVMTRDTDASIYDDDAESLREKKRSDLRNRAEIIDDHANNKNAVFVSIHQNKFPNPKYFGTQIFYSKNDPKSEELANSVKNSVVGLIQPENKRAIKPANQKIFLLNNAQIPAIVVECGFLSNEEEAKKLGSEDYQNKMAFSIYCGVLEFLTNNA